MQTRSCRFTSLAKVICACSVEPFDRIPLRPDHSDTDTCIQWLFYPKCRREALYGVKWRAVAYSVSFALLIARFYATVESKVIFPFTLLTMN